MPEIVVNCPSCQQEYSIDPSTLGRQFKCVQCQQTFMATAPFNPSSTAPSAAPLTAPSTAAVPAPFTPAGSYAPPPTMPPAYFGEAPPAKAFTSRAALASMICGFLCWLPPINLVALVLGIIGVAKTRNNQMRGGGMAVTGLVLGAIGVVATPFAGFCGFFMYQGFQQAKQIVNGQASLRNMQSIGQVISEYKTENQGALPPDLETLVSAHSITPAMLVYPGGKDTPASGAGDLESGGHLSYVYLGPGKTTLADQDRVVLFENGRGHMDQSPQGRVLGLNVLFADGHAEFESKSTADRAIQATRDALGAPAGN